ncbi:MAG: hypothetical protein FWF69_04610 [Firmicutes bacterium]|nr:hypothetical protein [Bacillota bacterium]
MSQEDTYRPAVLPSEAVMMPAIEEAVDEPFPVAQDTIPLDEPLAIPADDPSMGSVSRSPMSYALEKMRNQSRIPQNLEWMSTTAAPLDRGVSRPSANQPQAAQPEGAMNRPSMSQGSALTTLMRSAARQYRPAPSLMPSQPMMPPQMPQNVAQPMQQGPQMRGALRQVVRNVQQPQGNMPYQPGAPMGK